MSNSCLSECCAVDGALKCNHLLLFHLPTVGFVGQARCMMPVMVMHKLVRSVVLIAQSVATPMWFNVVMQRWHMHSAHLTDQALHKQNMPWCFEASCLIQTGPLRC